jgi:hypothetical protein
MQTALKTQFAKVSDKLTLEHTGVEDDNMLHTEYKCNVEVQLAGDSMWDCEIERVTITGIHIVETFDEDDGDVYTQSVYAHIGVTYEVDGEDGAEVEGSWRLYTDNGFSDAVSELLGTDVDYTEQGMQDDGYASMEL